MSTMPVLAQTSSTTTPSRASARPIDVPISPVPTIRTGPRNSVIGPSRGSSLGACEIRAEPYCAVQVDVLDLLPRLRRIRVQHHPHHPRQDHISRDRVGQAQRQDRGQSAIGDSENENDEPDADDPQPENREATKPRIRSLNLSALRAKRLL